MADLSVIDRFTETFSRYIDSGFGLLSGEVSFLSSTLVVIDLTLAGLAWSVRSDDQILVTLAKKILYVGAFAFIIGNFKSLADIIFNSFSGIGLKASGGTLSPADLARPGFVAAAGFTAAHPLLEEASQFSGFDVLTNLPTIVILLFCWIVIVLAFFVLSIQLFVTLIEFKLTTLASFILVPFALWGKTAFLAEKTLGNVVASGVKVMVLAIIVGIGSTIFGQLASTLTRPVDIASAMSLLLAALALFGLGIFGPGIAAGLVSGAPQLGAGSAAGTVAGAAAVAIGGGAVAMGGLRMAAGGSMTAVRSAASLSAASSIGDGAARAAAAEQPAGGGVGRAGGAAAASPSRATATPARHAREAAQITAHTLKEGDKGGHSSGPKLGED
ncbi:MULTISPECIES: P-type conjugative transfer protein TrbL [Bradyrhizobium]|jgi:type IV secretion system protein TrbL|uniref:P-type conjugative transfer protein TrbL n=1 Tax=Bradyrhizobium TaxID=374 RepID=UPI000483209C|nr:MULTISPECIES: P-type conjugative transfer protein TrbL [Bradyrhizobium]MCS3448633.1 type IV secretion system protein TrbL [Bradyrhizobium elkanii]MCS3560223.1 type IV secretion system protein TrbL [Bradyrhizobium elkanii]MCW2149930.1 type IV secretion system protein TrbL [Bradyrhizobium elkanii]MCW2360098.1 type IV secretion system protein TrbL [Bradyrhizobium elkanii]MCW2373662.1 type IV secretion system protein TrbL [Bradyrhizobium elkanii]